MHVIPFNKPYISGKEVQRIEEAIASGKLSGDGPFSNRCQRFFEERYDFHRCLLTPSCTGALEMAAILCDVGPEDEVIAPSFAFTSTVNAFALRGAKIRFADSCNLNPNIDVGHLSTLITEKTKAIVIVHYAGIACDMNRIMELSDSHSIPVIEDAAQAIDSFHYSRPLGTFGPLSAMSFHETKNVVCGEGGLLCINDPGLVERAEIIREKGTNRAAFFRGEVDKYGWVDIGSSFLPPEIVTAFLYAQLERIDEIQGKRVAIWGNYFDQLADLEKRGCIQLPQLPQYASNNGHMFYLTCEDLPTRTLLIEHLKSCGIMAVFHYQPLHSSEFYKSRHTGQALENTDRYADTLLRLPLYPDLQAAQVSEICDAVRNFFA